MTEASAGGGGPVERIAAIVTAYHPDERVLAVIASTAASCDPVIVVDNTPEGADLLDSGLSDRVMLLRPGRNLGLAGALNLGISRLDAGVQAVLLMDQDSVIPSGMVGELAAHLDDPAIGAAAPAPWDAASGSFIDPRTGLRPDVADRGTVITSGLLVRRDALDRVGGFREDFFVDCVDLDFCLRLRRTGARIVQDKRVRLPHTLGDTRMHRFLVLKLRVTHHPTWRLYWNFRNQTLLVKENWKNEPAWCAAAMLILVRWAVLTALYEAPRVPRVKAIVRGFRDGLRGRTTTSYLPTGDGVPVVVDRGA